MKKLAFPVALLVFLVTFWIGVTYVVGNKAKSYYMTLLDEPSQFGFVSLSNISYTRGFMQSHAETLMEINLGGDKSHEGEVQRKKEPITSAGNIRIVFEHEIFHGPFPISNGPASRYGFGPAIALFETRIKQLTPDPGKLEDYLEKIPELKHSLQVGRIRLDGTTDGLLEIPAFDYQDNNVRTSSGGLTSEIVYSPVSGTLSGAFTINRMAINAPELGHLAWQGLSGEFDMDRPLPMLYVGFSKTVVGGIRMEFLSPENGQFERINMEDITVTSNSNFDGHMVKIEQNTTLGGLVIDGEKYGPLVIDVEVKNLDGRALSDFQQKVVGVYQASASLDPELIAANVLPIYLDLFKTLLAGDPEIKLRNISLVTPRGQAQGSFEIKTTGIKNASFNNPVAVMKYLKNVESLANLSIDESLAKAILLQRVRSSIQQAQNLNLSEKQSYALAKQQCDQQLEMMIEQNLIVRDGKKLKSVMSLKRGRLFLNGQLLPLLPEVK